MYQNSLSFLKLKNNWLTILYYFQIYSTIIQYFLQLQNDHHNKSSCHLSPFKLSQCYWPYRLCQTIITSLWFLSETFCFLISLTYFTHPPHPTLFCQLPVCCMYLLIFCVVLLCLFISFVFEIPSVSEILWCLSFSAWLIPLSIISSRTIHVVANGNISFIFMTE